jgi:hypothetical protein
VIGPNGDEYKVIKVNGIVYAQGWKCGECGVIRPEAQLACDCYSSDVTITTPPAQLGAR